MKPLFMIPLALLFVMCMSGRDEAIAPQLKNQEKEISDSKIKEKITIKGKVVSSVDKKPISGVNILFNPTDTIFMGTISNNNGDFLFVAEHRDVVMKFQCQGYLSRQVAWDGSKEMVVELNADEN